MLDAVLALATQLRWVSRAFSDVDAADIAGHPLIAENGVPVLEDDPALARPAPWRTGSDGDPWPDDVRWLWFLPADARPRPDALGGMTSMLRDSDRVALVGPKLVRADASRVVLGVGHRITRWGRSAESGEVGAYDQGQFDDRGDVIGVPLEGMVVRRQVLSEVGGLHSGTHPSVAGLDLCWRAHLHGYRVLVVPDAVVALTGRSSDGDVAVGRSGQTPLRQRAQARAELALARASWWRLAPRALAMLACGLWVSMLMLLLRRPRAASAAWAEAAAVLSVGRVARARWRFRGRGTVTERDLASVFDTGRSARSTARLIPLDGDPDPEGRLPVGGSASPPAHGGWADSASTAEGYEDGLESGPVSEELAAPDRLRTRARWWSPAFVSAVAVALVVTAVRWRDLASTVGAEGWGVRSPEVLGVSASAADLWSAWWRGWTGSGLGQGGPGPSWLLPLSGVTWLSERLPGGPADGHGAAVVTAWLLFSSVVLSVVVAYLAAASVVSVRAVRAALALGWAALAPLVMAVESGRLGPALVHVVAPAVVAGAVLSLRKGRQGTSAACGTALLIAVIAWWVPVMVIVGLVAGAMVGVFAPRASRWRAMVLALVPLALLGPHVVQYWSEPVLFFGGAGATVAGAEALPVWQALLMHPSGAARISIFWAAPIWVLALVAVLAPGGRSAGRLATGLTLGGLGGVAGGVLASRLVLGELPPEYAESGLAVTMWPGTFISVGAAAVFLAGGVGAARLLETAARRNRGRSLSAVLLAVAAVAAVATMVAQAVIPPGEAVRAAPAPLPAVVEERVDSGDGVRLLTLTPAATGSEQGEATEVRYDLQGSEPPAWLRDRARDLTGASSWAAITRPGASIGAPTGDPVASAVDTLAAPIASSPSQASFVQEQLAALAVGYVSVVAEEEHALVQRIDQEPALTRVSSAPGTALWRVLPEGAGSRLMLEAATGEPVAVVPSTGPHGRGRSETDAVGATGAVLTVAQPPQWARVAQVHADGVALDAEPGFPVRYSVPPHAREIVVEVPPVRPRWWAGTATLALVVAFVAVSATGNARRGRR